MTHNFLLPYILPMTTEKASCKIYLESSFGENGMYVHVYVHEREIEEGVMAKEGEERERAL